MENLCPVKYEPRDFHDCDEIQQNITVSVKQENEETNSYLCYQRDLESILKYTREILPDETCFSKSEMKEEQIFPEECFLEHEELIRHGNNEHINNMFIPYRQCGSAYNIKKTMKDDIKNTDTNNICGSLQKKPTEFIKNGPKIDLLEVTTKPKKINSKVNARKCSYCDYIAKDKKDWGDHRSLKHSKSMNRKCKFCDFVTNSACGLKLHLKKNHRDETLHKCEHCEYETGYVGHLNRHINSAHVNTRESPCRYCDFVAKDLRGLKRHIQKNHEKIVITGHLDSQNNPRIAQLVEVLDEAKETASRRSRCAGKKQFQCQYCEYSTFFMDYLSIHINSRHTQSTLYKCEYCEYQATKLYTLRCHINSKHTKRILYRCQLCNLETTRSNILKRHIQRIHVKKQLECPYCAYIAKKEGHLRNHLRKKHNSKVEGQGVVEEVKVEQELIQIDEFVKVETDVVKCEDTVS